MSKREKLLRKIRNNPNNVRSHELKTLLTQWDFVLARTTGSHHIYRYEGYGLVLILPIPLADTVVKPVYVKDVLAAIGQIEDAEE